MSLGAMEIFKYLPGGKREANANCKKCQCATCMMFAMKLSKGQCEPSMCPYVPQELHIKLEHNKKVQQKTYNLGNLKIGGETVLYRHEKTFLNPAVFAVVLDCSAKDFKSKLKRIIDFQFESIGQSYKIDAVYLKNEIEGVRELLNNAGIEILDDNLLNQLKKVEFKSIPSAIDELSKIRSEAVVNRNTNYCEPVYVHLSGSNNTSLCAAASSFICKYANMLLFDEFNEALFAALLTLRLNIFTDPQKPLQVESKVYEFNNPDENALVFLTTNFALSYFAVANELSALKCGSYLVITPSEGMSVLTAWSAQKITADIASKVVSANDILKNVKNKRIIIPGLLSDLKDELQDALKDWEIVVGTAEAYKIPEFVKKLQEET